MGQARFHFEPSTDVELVVNTIEQVFEIIDEQHTYRNPARCMRRLRRLFDNSTLRAAVRRLAAAVPQAPKS
jgi:hypothetical protein